MLARLRSWWRGRSRVERLLVGIGVPVAAIAALWGARQDRAAKATGADDEGGPGVEAAATSPNVLNVGAPGIGTDQIAQFTEVFSGEITGLERQLEELRSEFGQSPTERARDGTGRPGESDEEERFQLIPDRDFLVGDRVDLDGSVQRAPTTTKKKPANLKPTPRAIITKKGGEGGVGTTRTRYDRKPGAPTQTVGGKWSRFDYISSPSGASYPGTPIFRLVF